MGHAGSFSQSDSCAQTTTFARTHSALLVRSGGDSYALEHAAQWSLGTYALSPERLPPGRETAGAQHLSPASEDWRKLGGCCPDAWSDV